MRNVMIMLVVAAAVLCLSGLAGAATSITFLDVYDHDNDPATAMVNRPAGTYLWFDANNWTGGAIPQYEGETANFDSWYATDANGNASYNGNVVDLAGGVVDLYGLGYDPGDVNLRRTSGPFDPNTGMRAGLRIIDSVGGSYIKANKLYLGSISATDIQVPVFVKELLADYRGIEGVMNSTVDANTITIGQLHLTLNGATTVQTINMKEDGMNVTWPFVPSITVNAPVTGLTSLTMAAKMWGEFDANGDGALGTGTVDIQSGSVIVRTAQTTFPTSITVGLNCTLVGNLTGATYGAGGNVQFQPGSILGDTSGGGANPSRTDAGGATLYMPVVGIASGTIISGDDGSTAYKGIGIGPWSDSNSLGATIQARPASGDLHIGIAVRDFYFDGNTTLIGDGSSTTANIKVFPGNGQITLASGGINQTAIGLATPNLITTFNIEGVEGDKQGGMATTDYISSDERWNIFRTSGSAAILPGQTVKITNGVYRMDVDGDYETIQGRLIIGAGGALQLLDSNSSSPYVGSGEPIQSSATGHLEVQDRGLLVISGGDTLGDIGTDASRVTVSGTPLVSFSRADSGYWGGNTWTAEVTIDAAANPGLQKILDESNIVLHSIYNAAATSAGTSVFLGDGLRIREGGLVTTTWPAHSQAPRGYVGAGTVYFGPKNLGGSFTVAAGPAPINLYCQVADAITPAGTIYINSTDPIESFDNLTWYPYNINLGRVVAVPVGTVTMAGMVYADKIIVRNGTFNLSGGTTGTTEIRHDSTTGNLTISGVAVDVDKIVVNSGNFTLSAGTIGTSQGITFNSTGTMTLNGAAIDAPYVYVNAGTCNASGGSIDNLGMHVVSHGIVNISNDFSNGSATAASDGYVNINNSVTINNVTVDSAYVSGSSGVRSGGTAVNILGRLSGSGSWGNNYLRMNATGVVAPGGNSGNDVGAINDGGHGLWFLDGATIEWQLNDPGEAPGVGWDVIYGSTFDFAVTNETNAILNFSILDGGLTKDIVAEDKFAIAIIQGTGAIDIPTGTWTQNFDAPDNWDATGANLYYDTNDKTVYLTGLVVSLTLLGDADGNGVVDAADYIILKQHLGGPATLGAKEGDFDKDGDVDWTDLQTLMGNFGATKPVSAANTPEPATIGLLAIGALAIIRRRRRA